MRARRVKALEWVGADGQWVVTDPTMPAGVIELRHGDRVVGRVVL